jgi:hypothetical protein
MLTVEEVVPDTGIIFIVAVLVLLVLLDSSTVKIIFLFPLPLEGLTLIHEGAEGVKVIFQAPFDSRLKESEAFTAPESEILLLSALI